MLRSITIRLTALFFLLVFLSSGLETVAKSVFGNQVVKELTSDTSSSTNNSSDQKNQKTETEPENILSLPIHSIGFIHHINVKTHNSIILSEKSKQLFVLSILTPPPEKVC